MSIFEKPVTCNCNKPDCYFCWLKSRIYATTAVQEKQYLSKPEVVLMAVCRLTGVSPEDVKSKSRRLDVVIVRQVYCYAARELTGASMKGIGEVVNRDHATVIHSYRVVQNMLATGNRNYTGLIMRLSEFDCFG
jgi:chromosomal replication initiation ATPase DnaA